MKLYLSSYGIGNDYKKLVEMIGPNKSVAIVSNALDYSTDTARREASISQNISDFQKIGLDAVELDLKSYFGKTDLLESKIHEFGLVWARGGNCFILLKAMRESGLDVILNKHRGDDTFVYGGYSAGVCVVTPTLHGLELVDDAYIIPKGYREETVWDGVGLIDYSFAPHYRSDHRESEAINGVVEYYIENKMLFRALRDGEVIIGEA